MSLCARVFYGDVLYEINLPPTANLYDLKRAAQEKTEVSITDQIWEDIDLTDDVPLVVMDLENPLFLQKRTGSTTSSATNSPYKPPVKSPVNSPVNTPVNTPVNQQPANQQPENQQPVPFNPNPYLPMHPPSDSKSKAVQMKRNPKTFNLIPQLSKYSSIFKKFLDGVQVDTDYFTAIYEQKWGGNHPRFIGGSFTETFDIAKTIQKPVFICLLNHQNLESRDFCSVILSTRDLKSSLEQKQIPFWVGEVSGTDEKQFFTQFGCPISYPFLILAANINNTLIILEEFCGVGHQSQIESKLSESLGKYGAHLIEQEERERLFSLEREMIQRQNEDYSQSEAIDAQKERELQKTRKLANENKNILVEARKNAITKLNTLPAETSDSVSVGIKLTDGERIERKFPSQTPLQVLFDWVEGKIAEKKSDETFMEEGSPPIEGEGTVVPFNIKNFELLQNFPKKTFGQTQNESTLKQLDIGNRALLLLQRKS